KFLVVFADLLDTPGNVRAQNVAQPTGAGVQGFPHQPLPVRSIDRDGINLDQEFIIRGSGCLDVIQSEVLRRSIVGADNCFHRLPSTVCAFALAEMASTRTVVSKATARK